MSHTGTWQRASHLDLVYNPRKGRLIGRDLACCWLVAATILRVLGDTGCLAHKRPKASLNFIINGVLYCYVGEERVWDILAVAIFDNKAFDPCANVIR